VAHPVVHFEIAGKDLKESAQFYASLFDWEIDTNAMGGEYGLVQSGDGGIGGGLMTSPMGQPYVTVYVQVDDLPAYLAKVESLGGKAMVQPTEIPGGGSFAMFQDPSGNMVGLYKP
jgi:predicted enzyme related to lactoylglutathione lyase